MRSYVKLSGWDDESSIKLQELREKVKSLNESPVTDSNGFTISYYVVRLFSKKGHPYFSIQKRKYKKKEKIPKDIENNV
jgi:hypothetical protein